MKRTIAKHLLNIHAVLLRPENPFTWTSGIKSPIYCDNRLTLSYPEVRRDIEAGLCEIVKEHCHTIVDEYIDLFYDFETKVKKLMDTEEKP